MYEAKEALGAEMMPFWIIFGIAVYIWVAICLQKIAEKTNTSNSRLAWIPGKFVQRQMTFKFKSLLIPRTTVPDNPQNTHRNTIGHDNYRDFLRNYEIISIDTII